MQPGGVLTPCSQRARRAAAGAASGFGFRMVQHVLHAVPRVVAKLSGARAAHRLGLHCVGDHVEQGRHQAKHADKDLETPMRWGGVWGEVRVGLKIYMAAGHASQPQAQGSRTCRPASQAHAARLRRKRPAPAQLGEAAGAQGAAGPQPPPCSPAPAGSLHSQ